MKGNHINIHHAPGGMRAGFEYYRDFPIDAEQNKELSETKLQILTSFHLKH